LRVSLYDPLFFMPSISTAKINVNFEPTIGEVIVNLIEGDSLDTIFTFIVEDFIDEDLPLIYRFFYYYNSELYELERELGVNPINSKRDYLADTLYQNELSSYLSMG
jgi:hypothetical protein